MLQLPQLNRGVLGRLGLAGGADIVNLYAARAARGFGDGFAAIILPAYLLEIGFNPFQIGLVATAALLGSAATTLAIGLLAPRYHLRTLLLACAALMVVTGIAFPSLQHFVFIAVVAFIGTILLAAQEFISKRLGAVARAHENPTFGWVVFVFLFQFAVAVYGGYFGAGMGILMLAALGLIGALFYSRLPRAEAADTAPRATALGPSRRRVYKLAALFSLDAFAGGFTVQSLMALWLFERFDLSLAAASAFFFWSNVLTAFSYPVAARLGKRFGLVNTMVFTHIPSSLCLILAAFSPSLTIVLALLLVRSALSQMDVPTRTSYVMAVVTPAERTAAASVTAVPRSLASAVSPAICGALLSTSFLGLPLILCGVLKIAYDLSLLFSFRHIKPPEEKEASR